MNYCSRILVQETGRFKLDLDSHQRIFIDRDGQYFHFILMYLRDGIVDIPEDASPYMIRRLKAEFDFYNFAIAREKNYVYAIGGYDGTRRFDSVEKFDTGA